jgi:monoamine oxidase
MNGDASPISPPALIVGGGLAGLYAAYRLEQAHIPYLLWEAQPRWGGRIDALPLEDHAALGVDLGPTWFWPHQDRMQRLCSELGLTRFEQYVAGDVLYQLKPEQAPQRSAGAGAMVSYRLEGGMPALIAALVKHLNPPSLKLNHALTSLTRTGEVWTATAHYQGETLQLQTQQLIIAAPPRKIATPLRPHLPARLYDQFCATPTWMAAQAKFVAVYDTAFWRNAGLAGQAFSRVGPMVEIHDASSAPHAGHALFGFVGVPAQVRRQHGQAAMEAACLNQLVAIFGPEAGQPRAMRLKDWAQEEWIASEQDLAETPQHPDFNLAPWTPELKRLGLHLVGSEFAREEGGYLEGALNAVDSFLNAALKEQ